MSTYSITDARAALPDLISQVQQGSEVAITRHGEVVAVLVGPSRLRSRRTSDTFDEAARLHEMLESSPGSPVSTNALTVERAEELIAAIRRDRDGG